MNAVLAVNCGSSSLKFGVYRCEENSATLLFEGEAEEIGSAHSSFWTKRAEDTEKRTEEAQLPDYATAVRRALGALNACGAPRPAAVGHRFVHGGPEIRRHQLITPEVRDKLRAAVEYAPLHLPPALATLDVIQEELAHVPQIACLDTAFHRTMPDVSSTYALPATLRKLGVERFGFHGLSYESVIAQLVTQSGDLPEKLVVAHLGNGSSIAAIHKGQSIDTTMGLTPTGGVMMGTRCGDLDPGVMIYLMRHGYSDPQTLETLVDKQSGLLGVSGKGSDVRELLAARSGVDNRAKEADLALRMFCYQVRKSIAGMAAAMGGLHTIVFTGGIGEHAAELRNEICSGLKFLGEHQLLVLPAEEDRQIARIAAKLLN